MKRFQRTIESFVCKQCGTNVEGNGYTNHCPQCLYSKHVDINPGDRLHKCQGLMKPVQILVQASEPYAVIHECQICYHHQKTKLLDQDSMDTILTVMRNFVF